MKLNIGDAPNPTEGPNHEVADIFQLYGKAFRQNHDLPFWYLKTMQRITYCRTAVMGGHLDECDECGFRQNAYNSCGDRHCPKCRGMAKEQWLNDRKSELLPTGYFHSVFTLPHLLNPIVLCNMKITLDILFEAVNETLQAFAADPEWRLEGQIGFIGVLHTWSQTLLDHFHLHCLIPGGALSFDKKQWKHAGEKFLFKTESMAKDFKKRYIAKLIDAYEQNQLIFPGNTAETGTPDGFKTLIDQLWNKNWIVYAKRPFAGPEQVIEYLGRYTHRVAISNHRIKAIDDGKITFSYRDRSDENKLKEMTLKADEFIRRFLLHILPKGFVKIRYFGFLFHRGKKENIALIRELIGSVDAYEKAEAESVQEIMLRLTGLDITLCPKCKKGHMNPILEIPKGAVSPREFHTHIAREGP